MHEFFVECWATAGTTATVLMAVFFAVVVYLTLSPHFILHRRTHTEPFREPVPWKALGRS